MPFAMTETGLMKGRAENSQYRQNGLIKRIKNERTMRILGKEEGGTVKKRENISQAKVGRGKNRGGLAIRV